MAYTQNFSLEGKVALINGRLRKKDYEKLQKAGAAAILTFSGTTIDRLSDTDCDIRKLREILTEDSGACTALHMRTADAAEIIRRGAAKARGLAEQGVILIHKVIHDLALAA